VTRSPFRAWRGQGSKRRAAGDLGHHRPKRPGGRRLPGPPRVRRVDLATLDPFVHMDQMGEVDYAPGEPKGTP